MSAAPANQLDLTAPPVVKTIAQRSLIVGVVFGIVAVVLAYSSPDEFYRGYLLGFMCWLGVALGSMAILMIRHLTGGGWGMVIRRILGAAMRTLPLLARPLHPDHHRRTAASHLSWAHAAGCDPGHAHPRTSREAQLHQRRYLNTNGFIIRAIIYFAIWNVLSFLLSHWSKQTDRAGAPDNTRTFQGRRRSRPHPLRVHHLLRRDRLGHVARSQLDLHHLRPDHSHR